MHYLKVRVETFPGPVLRPSGGICPTYLSPNFSIEFFFSKIQILIFFDLHQKSLDFNFKTSKATFFTSLLLNLETLFYHSIKKKKLRQL